MAIFGWDTDLQIHKNFVHTRYPHNFEISPLNKSRSKKYVMLCSNRNLLCGPKTSSLYNKRQEVISYFERRQNDFHLYGAGWEYLLPSQDLWVISKQGLIGIFLSPLLC